MITRNDSKSLPGNHLMLMIEILDLQISVAVAGRLKFLVPVFVGVNRAKSIYIPVETLTTNEPSDVFH